VFYFFSHRTKYFEIHPTHIGTFGFALPTSRHTSKTKRANFANAPKSDLKTNFTN
jgi:hypothetical protein